MLKNRIDSADQHYSSGSLKPGFVIDALVGLKGMRIGLKNRLVSLYRSIIPGSFQEASAWRVFSSELGSRDPITRAIDPRMNSNLQNITDRYQRRV